MNMLTKTGLPNYISEQSHTSIIKIDDQPTDVGYSVVSAMKNRTTIFAQSIFLAATIVHEGSIIIGTDENL
jgi:hypothetical protein